MGGSRTGHTGSNESDQSFEALAQGQGALARKVNELAQSTRQRNAHPITRPQIKTIPLTQNRQKKGVETYCVFIIPGDTDTLICYYRKQGEPDTASVKQVWDDIKDAELLAGEIERKFDKLLDYSTAYEIIQLVAVREGGGKNRNPDSKTPTAVAPGYLARWTSIEQFNAPSAPSAGLIVYNSLDPITPDIYDAHAGLKVYAPLNNAGGAQSFGDALVDWVEVVITRDFGTEGIIRYPFRRLLNAAELSQTEPGSTPAGRGFVVIDANNLVPGGVYTWIENTVHTVDGKKTTTGSVIFTSANFGSTLSSLLDVALVVKSTEPFDSKHVQPFLEFRQPTTIQALKNFTFKYKKTLPLPAATDWEVPVVRNNSIQSDSYHRTMNVGNISIPAGSKNVTGASGTEFTKLQEGWKINVGAQTLVIGTITDDTHMTVTTNSAVLVTNVAYTVVCVVPIMDSFKVKPSSSYDLLLTLRTRNGANLDIPQTLTTNADGNVVMDVAEPSGLAKPILEWTAEGKIRVRGMVVTTDIHTLKKKYLVLYDGTSSGSTKFFDFAGRTGITGISNEASARFEFGLKSHVPFPEIKLKKYTAVFGTTSPTNVKAYWYAENDKGVSLKSADSDPLDLTSQYDFMGGRDTVRGLDVESTMTSPGNILGNGDWILVNVDEQYNWARWDALTTPLPAIGSGLGSGAYRTVRSTSTEINYVDSAHAGKFVAGTSYQLLQNVKQRFLPGETYAYTMFLKAVAPITVTIKLHLYNLERPVLTGTAVLTSSTAVTGTGGTLFTSELQVGDQIVISNQKRMVTNIFNDSSLQVNSAFSGASGAINVIIDNINNTISQSLNLTTSNQLFGAVFSMKANPNKASTAGGTDYARHQFGIEFVSNTQDILLDKNMCIRGEQPMLYAPRGDEVDSLASSAINPSFIAAPDIVKISGTYGGWKDPDTGGFITIVPGF